jgi:hypothetical protein
MKQETTHVIPPTLSVVVAMCAASVESDGREGRESRGGTWIYVGAIALPLWRSLTTKKADQRLPAHSTVQFVRTGFGERHWSLELEEATDTAHTFRATEADENGNRSISAAGGELQSPEASFRGDLS